MAYEGLQALCRFLEGDLYVRYTVLQHEFWCVWVVQKATLIALFVDDASYRCIDGERPPIPTVAAMKGVQIEMPRIQL